MVKAVARTNDGKLILILGVSEGNVERMKAGEPIYFDMDQLGFPKENIKHVTMFYGKDEGELTRAIKDLIGPETKVNVIPRGSDGRS